MVSGSNSSIMLLSFQYAQGDGSAILISFQCGAWKPQNSVAQMMRQQWPVAFRDLQSSTCFRVTPQTRSSAQSLTSKILRWPAPEPARTGAVLGVGAVLNGLCATSAIAAAGDAGGDDGREDGCDRTPSSSCRCGRSSAILLTISRAARTASLRRSPLTRCAIGRFI